MQPASPVRVSRTRLPDPLPLAGSWDRQQSLGLEPEHPMQEASARPCRGSPVSLGGTMLGQLCPLCIVPKSRQTPGAEGRLHVPNWKRKTRHG